MFDIRSSLGSHGTITHEYNRGNALRVFAKLVEDKPNLRHTITDPDGNLIAVWSVYGDISID